MADSAEVEQETVPAPSLDEILACQFQEWYSKPVLKKKSFRSSFIELPEEFMTYLGQDGIILPDCVDDSNKKIATAPWGDDEYDDFDYDPETGKKISYDDDSDDGNNSNDKNDGYEKESGLEKPPDLSELNVQLNALIEQVGNDSKGVFVKLNWSSPLDAAWINAGSMCCKRTAEIYQLFKASDRALYDIEHMMLACDIHSQNKTKEEKAKETRRPEKLILAARRWVDINPSMEFRLFVRDARLVGICQRDKSTFYDFLAPPTVLNIDYDDREGCEKEKIYELLCDFFFTEPKATDTDVDDEESNDDVDAWIGPALGLKNYTVDVYIDSKKKVHIVDCGVLGYPTDPLLFNWSDIFQDQEQEKENGQEKDSSSRAEPISVFNANANEGKMTVEGPLPPTTATNTTTATGEGTGNGARFGADWSPPFLTVESRTDVRTSALHDGGQVGPIDVSLAPDFSQFMKIVAKQRQEEEG